LRKTGTFPLCYNGEMHRSENELPLRMAKAWRRHERRWKSNRYVYAVVSRRSRGISIGINLNPDKGCNFDCIYCQVNRNIAPEFRRVDLQKLSDELDLILGSEKNGSLYEEDERFQLLTQAERGVRDIAFSGDGEPTTFPRFGEAVRIAADARRRFDLNSTKLVLITDAAYLSKPAVRAALEVMDENNGEIWAKLDAGTEEYFRRVNRSNVSLKRIMENILDAARVRPIVIQSLWCRIQDSTPPFGEIEAYCDQLNALLAAGGRLKNLLLYTIARDPSGSAASPLLPDELDQIAASIKSRVPIPAEVFY
jgi:wyosine [tRNA(Phe)-imidazoG37] synthetase (radical SAM superfamily)